jgi:hypothetical protein
MFSIVSGRRVRPCIAEQIFVPAGVLLRLRGVRGLRLRPGRAWLWITYEGEPADHIAAAGEVFEIAHDGVCYVSAEAPTVVALWGTPSVRAGWTIERIEPTGARLRIAPLPLPDRCAAGLVGLAAALRRVGAPLRPARD